MTARDVKAIGTLVMCIDSVSVAGQPFFMGLGDLPGDPFESIAYALSADGRTVVGAGRSGIETEAVVFSSGTVTGLGDLDDGEFYSNALGVSSDGLVIVGQATGPNAPRSAVRWVNGSISTLGELSLHAYSEAWDVAADGSTIVGASGQEAFVWAESSGMVGLGDLTGGILSSIAYAVSDNAAVIVGKGNNADGRPEAVRWVYGSPQALGFLGTGLESTARSVSGDGLVIVGWSATGGVGGTQGFRWESGEMVGLGGLPGEEAGSSAFAVSYDGSLVGGTAMSSIPGGIEAVLWDRTLGIRRVKDILTDLGISANGWTLAQVTGLSADGKTIIGSGRNPSNQQEGWIAHIPEPSTVSFLFLFLLMPRCRQSVLSGR